MPKQVTARGGDSVESIAFRHGHFWETVWNDPGNEGLRNSREEPAILEEGDVVTVPDLRPKQVGKATDHRYRFRRKGVPSVLRVRMMEVKDEDEPRVGLEYRITIGGRVQSGSTDGDGWLRCYVPADAEGGVLEFPGTGERYEFTVGDVRPYASLRGVQARLRNLGYYAGPVDGSENEEFEKALRLLQRVHEIEETGTLDGPTLQALKEEHGS